MKVRITREKIELDGESITYYPYYFDQWWDEEAEDRLLIVKKVLAQWADALDEAEESRTLYLPYSLDDQEVECFQADVRGDQVIFKCVEVNWNGYSMVLDELGDFISYPHKLRSEKPEAFGTYNRKELAAALRSPDLGDA